MGRISTCLRNQHGTPGDVWFLFFFAASETDRILYAAGTNVLYVAACFFFESVCKSQRASDYHRLRVLRERERDRVYVLLILVIMLCVFLSDI